MAQTITERHTIEYRDSLIEVPGASVETFVPVLLPGDTTFTHTVYRDTAGRAELTFWRDYAGRLRARCEAMDTMLKIERIRTVERIEVPKEIEVKRIPIWVWITFALQAVFLGIYLALKLKP